MSAIANIAIADGETSPVTHTFTPNGFTNGNQANWINRNASVPAASETMSLVLRPSTSSPEDYSTPGRKVSPDRFDWRLKYPSTYVDGVSGLTLVDFVDEVVITTLCHPRSSQQRRKNVRVFWTAIAAISQVYTAQDQREPIY